MHIFYFLVSHLICDYSTEINSFSVHAVFKTLGWWQQISDEEKEVVSNLAV